MGTGWDSPIGFGIAVEDKPELYLDENILGFYISVEDAIPVHMVDGLAKLVHVQLNLLLGERGFAICMTRKSTRLRFAERSFKQAKQRNHSANLN